MVRSFMGSIINISERECTHPQTYEDEIVCSTSPFSFFCPIDEV